MRESRLYGDPAPLGAVQEEYGIAPVILDPGTYTFDDLGTTITLTLEDHWRLDHARPGNFLLTRPDAELAALLPAAVFVRPIGLATPGRAATESLFPGSHGWEPWALADWIEAMPQIVELDRGSFDADGRTVRWFDIDVDPELGRTRQNCEPGSCVTMAWTGDSSIMVARDLERIRWYEIEDPAGPMIIFVAGRDREFDGLVADVDAMVRSARVGESRPHPVPTGYAVAEIIDLMANTVWRFAGVDGLTFESETFTAVEQRPGAVSHLVWGLESTVGFVVPRF
ncbi:MAG: hypothetical protein HKN41_04285, partial [Ilumatobacter sp.]|nr:hypothetical protein [Ilumatobacter sp.]